MLREDHLGSGLLVSLLENVYFHSFIHYGDLYSAPSRLLLRSDPDPCTAKKKSFETRVECVYHSLAILSQEFFHQSNFFLSNIRVTSPGRINQILSFHKNSFINPSSS